MEKDIFERMLAGGTIQFDDPQYYKIFDQVSAVKKLTVALNQSSDRHEIRMLLSEIIQKDLDEKTTVFTPFHTNFGKFISLGKNVFVNHDCTFLDLGGIIIEDDVMIGPKVQLITENHPVNPKERKALELKSILIKKNAWIAAGAIILPGVSIGENSVVAAGAVVTQNVPDNVVVGGIPAKIIKTI